MKGLPMTEFLLEGAGNTGSHDCRTRGATLVLKLPILADGEPDPIEGR